jgi:predicted SpoU family rRNA methylase
MQDYKGLNYAAIDGEEVRFGADFIFVNRKFTDATIQVAIDQLYENFAGNFKDTTDPKATVEQFKTGALYNKYVPGYGNGYRDNLQALTYDLLEKIGAEIEPVVTALLKRVKSLGDDGYGYGCTGRIAA